MVLVELQLLAMLVETVMETACSEAWLLHLTGHEVTILFYGDNYYIGTRMLIVIGVGT
jgi:hypothetical protein